MRFLTLLLSCFFPVFLGAQNVKNVNPRVKIIDGEPFYTHTYLEGQSIQQIAAAYLSTIEAIEKNNPNLNQLLPGRLIRIPYTDASLAVMSKYDLKPTALSKANMQDDASSMSSDRKEGSDDKTLENLMELAAELKSSLGILDSAQQKVIEKPILDKNGMPIKDQFMSLPEPKGVINKHQLLSDYLEAIVQPIVASSFNSADYAPIKEFFLIRVTSKGVITNIKDERTKMNNNTMHLIPDSLIGYTLNGDDELWRNQFLNIGLVAEVSQDTLQIKVLPNQLKTISGNPDQEQMQLIQSFIRNNGMKGKQTLVITDVDYFLAVYNQVEYNPFAEIREKLYQNSEKRISKAYLN